MKDLAVRVMNVLCNALDHRGACWVFNGPVGQRILHWAAPDGVPKLQEPDG